MTPRLLCFRPDDAGMTPRVGTGVGATMTDVGETAAAGEGEPPPPPPPPLKEWAPLNHLMVQVPAKFQVSQTPELLAPLCMQMCS